MNKTVLRKYAKLVVKMGVNVKKGQGVILVAETDQAEFALLVADEAYKAGAKWVDMQWSNQEMRKLQLRKESVKTLSTVLDWEKARLQHMVDELPARIYIASSDPDGLKGVNVEKMQKSGMARAKIVKPYRDAIDNKHQWTIVAVPGAKWAKKVFPGERTSVAVKKLWDAILEAVRVTKDNDPIEAWQQHNADLKSRYEKLNAFHFAKMHYYSENGTDFTAGLIPTANWMGGGDTLIDGTFFNPNMPTEEIFVSPMKGEAEGTVVSTMPLSYQGNLIENFSLTFEGGRVVSCKAEKGQELLERMITMDEGAAMLGELALIPHDSPISNQGILYYNTLFDENASCHLALGAGFPNTLEGYENMTMAETHEAGINDSIIHVDFMIGDETLNIDGITADGEVVPVFRNGNWTEKFC
ncbi:MAG: aminopeptidase [Clostridia bacterium]|nr:aminopeptidase [Clostridia bacterium]